MHVAVCTLAVRHCTPFEHVIVQGSSITSWADFYGNGIELPRTARPYLGPQVPVRKEANWLLLYEAEGISSLLDSMVKREPRFEHGAGFRRIGRLIIRNRC